MFRYPILIFFLLGFALWNVERFILPVTDGERADGERRIVVSQSDIAKMQRAWQKSNGGLPGQDELKFLINRYVEDELLVRQAIKQGLANSDYVVRMRLRKNIQFLQGKELEAGELQGKEQGGEKQEGGVSEGNELEPEQAEQQIKQAIAMGMQDSDPVVRRRLIQVMEEQIRRSIDKPKVTQQALADYRLAHQERYKRPGTWTFQQILFSRDKDGVMAQHRAKLALETIRHSGKANTQAIDTKAIDIKVIDFKVMGDTSLIPREFANSTSKHVARYLGESFLTQIASLPLEDWQGPMQSAFGWHLVRIEAHTIGDLPAIESIKNRLVIDWQMDEIEKLLRQQKKTMRESYEIVLEEPVS